MDHDDQRPFGDDFWNRRNPFNSLWSMTNLSPKIQRHLVTVYSNLSVTTLLASLACYLSLHGYLPDMSILPLILGILLLLFVLFSNPSPRTRTIRTVSLYGFGFAEGWGIAPFIRHHLDIDSNTVLLALIATLIAFVSFTASAVTSPRRSQLYLGWSPRCTPGRHGSPLHGPAILPHCLPALYRTIPRFVYLLRLHPL